MPEWKTLIAARLASLKLRPEREREIVEELAQHLGDRFQELRADGLDEETATRAAMDEIADHDVLEREMKKLKQSAAAEPMVAGIPRRRLIADLRQDLAYAVRVVRKSPGFAAAVVVTLALGIGANTAIFSLVNATLLERLPVGDRDRLFYVLQGAEGRQTTVSYPVYASIRDASRLIESLAAWGNITASLNADGETDLVSGAIVSGNFFETLGVGPARGRLLTPADDRTPGAHPVVVISHRLWVGRFGERDDIIGRDVRLNGQPFTIVGVTPPDFPGAEVAVWQDIYTPMMMQAWMRPPRGGFSGDMDPDLLRNRNSGWLAMVARLMADASRQQAQAEVEALAAEQGPDPRQPGRLRSTFTLGAIDEGDPRIQRPLSSIAMLLGAVVGAVLLIACANVANLLLAKAAARRREVAIRLAIGASRARIVRQLLTESILLALIGGALGVGLAVVVIELFHAMPPPAGALPIALEPRLDRAVLLFSLALSMLTGVVFGIAPAWQASKPELVPSLKDETLAGEGRGRRVNLKTILVVAEVALAVMLLIGAGLFVRSLRAIRSIDPGLATSELITAPININLLRYTKAQGREFYQQLIERTEQLPGVRSASVTRLPPLAGRSGARLTPVRLEGRPAGDARRELIIGETAAFANVVAPGYFETLGVPLLAGRDFHAQDLEDHPLVVIVNETFARTFFRTESPIGRRFTTGYRNAAGEWTEIVGLVRDSKYSALNERPRPVVYMPLSQRHESGMTLFVRSTVPPLTLIPQIRREIQQLEPNLPLPDLRSMEQMIRTQLYPERMGANLLAGFGALALVLAALGVYGVLAFSISRRQHELGVRMAIGADRGTIFALVLRQGLTLVMIGLAIGLIAGANLTHLVAGFLFGVGTLDAVTFAMVPLILTVIALIACYLPARRATRVDPVVALRNE